MHRAALAVVVALCASPVAAPGQKSIGPPEPNPARAAASERNTAEELAETAPRDRDGPLTTYPRAYGSWLQRKIAADLVELDRATAELATSLHASGKRREALKLAGRVVKLSHSIWSNLQFRRPTRERPELDQGALPRDPSETRADAAAAYALVDELAGQILVELKSQTVDANRRVATLELLERIELLGHRIKLDVEARK